MLTKNRTRFTAYITKYALTQGIFEREVEDCFNISPVMVVDTKNHHNTYHRDEWHREETQRPKILAPTGQHDTRRARDRTEAH